jgi:hypothetical protein
MEWLNLEGIVDKKHILALKSPILNPPGGSGVPKMAKPISATCRYIFKS